MLGFTKGEVREEQPSDRDWADHVATARMHSASLLGRLYEAQKSATESKDYAQMDELFELQKQATTLFLGVIDFCNRNGEIG